MAYSKKTWKARQGLGLNKFSIDGATPVPITNQPDSVTQQGDALSAGNLNDLENRIANAFDDVENEKADKTEVETQIQILDRRVTNLEQVSGDYVTSDMQDYSSVPTGKATYALVETLKGVSRVENQMVKNGNFASVSDWGTIRCSYTVSDGVATLSPTESGTNYRMYQPNMNRVSGHKYLLVMSYKRAGTSDSIDAYQWYDGANYQSLACASDTNWHTVSAILSYNGSSDGNDNVRIINNANGTENVSVEDVVIRDLTLYFNGNIPSNADTVAHIAQYYPELLEPRAYNAGEIVDSTYTKVESVGVNIWDEQTKVYSSTILGSKNHVPVMAGQKYFITQSIPSTGSDRYYIQYFDADDNQISYQSIYGNFSQNQFVFTVPNGCAYLMFYIFGTYGTTYLYDIQISACPSGTPTSVNTTYHPYMTDQLAIPSVTLRSAGSVSDTLDVESGEITRNVITIDLGSLTWTTDSLPRTGTNMDGIIKKVDNSVVANILCAKYETVARAYVDAYNEAICVNSGGYLIIRDTAFTGMTSAQISQALSGVYANIELATPTTESVSPTLDNTIKTEGGGTVYSDADVDGQFTMGFLNL